MRHLYAMAYQLGIDYGTTYTAAAVHRDGQVDVQTLGNRAAAVPTVIFLRADETILVGDPANRRGISDPSRVAREFKRRLGDPTPLMLGGTPYSAEALTAKLLRWVVDAVTERQGGPPDKIALSHPANWGPYKQDLLTQAVRLADLPPVVMLTEPQAAAISYASTERVEPGTVVAVYDLGGGTFDAAVLRKTADGFTHLGTPEGIERLGGIDFDEAVYNHILRATGDAVGALDPTDPSTLSAVARLRSEAVDAKEALSGDSDTSIPVLLPNVQTEVRLTRAEFEAMIRPTLADTLGALRRTLRSADLTPEDVHVVLLVGGSSRIPMVAQLVSAELNRPVAVDVHPKHAIATGAALAAARAMGHDAESSSVLPAPATRAPAAAAVPAEETASPPRPAVLATPAVAAEPPSTATAPRPTAADPPPSVTVPPAVPAAPGIATTVSSEPEQPRAQEVFTPTERRDQQRSRRPLLVGGIIGVLALVAVGVLLARPRPGPDVTATEPAVGSDQEAATEPLGASEIALTQTELGPDGATVEVPEGWPSKSTPARLPTLSQTATPGEGQPGLRYTDPTTGMFLETFWTDEPVGDDAHAFLHAESDLAASQTDSYELVEIVAYDVEGADTAATWEYVFSEEQVNGKILVMRFGGSAYILGVESRAQHWKAAQGVWQDVVDSFDARAASTAETPDRGEGIPGKERSAIIHDITVDDGRYLVDFETFGYTAEVPGRHVHFFFDTVPPEEAGRPGSGPWFLYGGPSPFQEWTVEDRPDGATKMCILVAREDHSVLQDTGNCFDLP